MYHLVENSIIRLFDIAIAIILLPILALSCLILAILNLRFNPGPLFYTQTRIGYKDKEYTILKFRSMLVHESRELFADQQSDMIPNIGKTIRLYRIDELPQIINVLLGHMSIVGPRPERPAFVSSYHEELNLYSKRHQVRPGITGLAQVEFEYTSSIDGTRQKLKYDLFFIKNRSISLYLYVIFKTFGTIVLKKGAE